MRILHIRLLLRLAALCLLTAGVFFTSASAQKPKYPAYTGHVNDFAGVLDSATREKLETILLNFEKKSGAQIAVVTIKTLGERPIEDYANGLYRSWGIGAKSGEHKDKGALLLIATEDRRSRLEVGYGLEGDLPDGLAGEMLRRMRPYFKQMAWSEGVTVGVRTLVDTLAQKWNISLEGIDQRYAYGGPEKQDDGGFPIGLLVGIGILFLVILIIASRNKGGPGPGGRTRRGLDPGIWWGPLILNRGGGGFGGGTWGSSDGGGGGWSGGGGGGGGWGGFGGGSSGGGGASDSW
jgi:uncharacterized protein